MSITIDCDEVIVTPSRNKVEVTITSFNYTDILDQLDKGDLLEYLGPKACCDFFSLTEE